MGCCLSRDRYLGNEKPNIAKLLKLLKDTDIMEFTYAVKIVNSAFTDSLLDNLYVYIKKCILASIFLILVQNIIIRNNKIQPSFQKLILSNSNIKIQYQKQYQQQNHQDNTNNSILSKYIASIGLPFFISEIVRLQTHSERVNTDIMDLMYNSHLYYATIANKLINKYKNLDLDNSIMYNFDNIKVLENKIENLIETILLV